MLRGHDILCISSIDWDFVWQGHQEIMSTLARHGNRVLFVENTGVRAAELRDLPRLWHRLSRWWHSTKGFREELANLYVFSPLILPFPQSRLAVWINRRLMMRALRRWMRATGFRRPLLWTFLPTKLVVDLINHLEPELAVYYCLADFGQLTQRPAQLARTERLLVDRCDVVFVHGEALRDRCAPHPNIQIIPVGVNLETFQQGSAPAPELLGLKTPIIGYVGGIHRHVDFELLTQVARDVEGTLVLVGPIQTDVGSLRGLDNVAFIGLQPHRRMPEFMHGFDVGIIPYALNEYTRTVYPTKLSEYLAVGLPVVATDLPEIRKFNAAHGDVVTIASSASAFTDAVREAVHRRSPDETARRIAVARENSWNARIERMSLVIEEALQRRRETRGSRWEETLHQVYRAARRRFVGVTGAAFMIYLGLFWSPLPWLVAAPLRLTAKPVSADAIVVFAGGVGESGRGGEGYQERTQRAVELYGAGKARHVIFSTGWAYTFHEARLMEAIAVSLGVPEEAIILESKAGSTYENVRFTTDILRARGWRKILLVSSPYHMRRAVSTFHRLAPDIEVVPTPAKSSFYAHGLGASLAQIRAIAHEHAAIAYYWLKGWI